MTLTFFLILVIIILYLFQIVKYRIGWDKIKGLEPIVYTSNAPKVSVVIAMRNEESQIERLITQLKTQIYPIEKLDFVFVNDHSTDATLELLQKFRIENLKIVNMPDGKFGKKNAIRQGVALADGEIILATDADCSFSSIWVQTMATYFVDPNIKLVSGPVQFYRKKGILQNLQALEFTSLIGTGAGAIGGGSAIFCNGANMAYRKAVFLEVNNFENDIAASGDDVFLLHSVKAKYPKSIVFAKNENAIVITQPLKSFKAFINQRKRWTAKTGLYKDFASIYVSLLVLFSNLSIVFLFGAQFFYAQHFKIFILFYILKTMVDLFFLYPVLRFFKREDLIKWIVPFELFYSFYIVLIVILSFTKSFEWKGRAHKK